MDFYLIPLRLLNGSSIYLKGKEMKSKATVNERKRTKFQVGESPGSVPQMTRGKKPRPTPVAVAIASDMFMFSLPEDFPDFSHVPRFRYRQFRDFLKAHMDEEPFQAWNKKHSSRVRTAVITDLPTCFTDLMPCKGIVLDYGAGHEE
jgi:hypothetical protein